MIADNDVVPPVEQRIHCCRHHVEKEAAYVAEHAASVVGIEMKDEYSVHDIDNIAVVRVAVVVAVGGDDYYIAADAVE